MYSIELSTLYTAAMQLDTYTLLWWVIKWETSLKSMYHAGTTSIVSFEVIKIEFHRYPKFEGPGSGRGRPRPFSELALAISRLRKVVEGFLKSSKCVGMYGKACFKA